MDHDIAGRTRETAHAILPLTHLVRMAVGDADPLSVDIWAADIDRAGEYDHVLSPDERDRARRFRFERDRQRFVTCRALLRCVLASCVDAGPGEIELTHGDFGKPRLKWPAAADLDFNVSHAGGFALFAISNGAAVGIDLERIRPLDDVDRLARAVFSAAEQRAFEALPPAARTRAFYDGWTRKEAYIKALGDGLQHPLDTFAVTLAPGAQAQLLHVDGRPGEPARWHLAGIDAGPAHAAAICVERRRLH
ncbi:MAG: 4'-phosphopantetheinyl transferase superfamily protein [Acidobacteria bacterium]|nr:4'-phosphopantetheinyl transferase superfamily protein [Acidobacteriota bacterium]